MERQRTWLESINCDSSYFSHFAFVESFPNDSLSDVIAAFISAHTIGETPQEQNFLVDASKYIAVTILNMVKSKNLQQLRKEELGSGEL